MGYSIARVGRSVWLFALAICFCVGVLPSVAAGTTGPLSGPAIELAEGQREEATLWDVDFVDPDQGWAVGDLGVIYSTRDGGENWREQASGTTASLRDVCFTSPTHGIAVGGWSEADTGLGRGLVLRTTDGGQHWSVVPTDLPMLYEVTCLADGSWVAHGDWSAIHFGRVFASSDRGLNWVAVDAAHNAGARSVGLSSERLLYAEGHGGLHEVLDLGRQPVAVPGAGFANSAIFAAGGAALTPANSLDVPQRPRCEGLKIRDETAVAWFANGRVSVSRDAGRRWQAVDLDMVRATPVTEMEDAHDIAAAWLPGAVEIAEDGTIWLAGIPGDCVWQISTDGRVERSTTGVVQPIRGLHFWDRYRGWAVGAFGTILTTRDGGRTWRPQRNVELPSRRAMVVAVAASPEGVPWTVLGRESLEFGWRSGVVLVDEQATRPRDAGAGSDPCGTSRELAARFGGLAIGSHELLALRGGWDAQEVVGERILVGVDAALASLSPSVLVLSADLPSQLRGQLRARAMTAGVSRIYEVTDEQTVAAEVTLHRSAILPVAGLLVSDLAEQAQQFVSPWQPISERTSLRLVWDQAGGGRSSTAIHGLAGGLAASGGQWSVPSGRRRNLQVLQARSGQRSRIERLLADAGQTSQDEVARSLEMLLQQTPEDRRVALLRRVLRQCEQAAANGADGAALRLYLLTLREASETYSKTPLGRWSALRLAAMEHSAEWQTMLRSELDWGFEGGGEANAAVAAHRSPFERSETQPLRGGIAPLNAIQSGGVLQAAGHLQTAQTRPNAQAPAGDHSAELVEALGDSPYPAALYELGVEDSLIWRLNPHVLSWKAKFGLEAMEAWDRAAWQRLGEASGSGAWRDIVAPGEGRRLRVAEWRQVRESQRPWLDGNLDDAIWQRTQAVQTPDGFTLRMAMDPEYYYVGIEGIFVADDRLAAVRQRRRDESLQDRPRVRLEWDIDGDLLTAYVLTIDAQGRTRDEVDGFPQWRPEWFVSTAVEAGVRTVEIAIDRKYVDLPSEPSRLPSDGSFVQQASGEADGSAATKLNTAVPKVTPSESHYAPLRSRMRLRSFDASEGEPRREQVDPSDWWTLVPEVVTEIVPER